MSCPPPKLNKLLRLYGPAYLHAEASIPPTTMALPPFSRLLPLFRHASPPPAPFTQTIFGHFIRNFVQFYARFQ